MYTYLLLLALVTIFGGQAARGEATNKTSNATTDDGPSNLFNPYNPSQQYPGAGYYPGAGQHPVAGHSSGFQFPYPQQNPHTHQTIPSPHSHNAPHHSVQGSSQPHIPFAFPQHGHHNYQNHFATYQPGSSNQGNHGSQGHTSPFPFPFPSPFQQQQQQQPHFPPTHNQYPYYSQYPHYPHYPQYYYPHYPYYHHYPYYPYYHHYPYNQHY